MSAIYFNIINNTPTFHNIEADDDCPICYEKMIDMDPSNQKEIVAHINGGEKHPFHLQCIKDYAKSVFENTLNNNIICPSCRIPIKIKGFTNKNLNAKWIFETVLGSANVGLSSWGLLSQMPYPQNIPSVAAALYSIKYLYETEEKFGAVIGSAIGTLVGTAVISGTSSIFADSLENQEETGALYGDSPGQALTMLNCIALGTGLGQYVQRKYFSE